jgi:hypothetical protein
MARSHLHEGTKDHEAHEARISKTRLRRTTKAWT